MTHLLFLSMTSHSHELEADQPLLIDDVRAVSICHLRLGAPKDEFLTVKHFILATQEDTEDFCSAINAMCFAEEQPPIILTFSALHVVRRLAAHCIKRKVKFIPAVYYCGPSTRVFDIVKYLTANDFSITAQDLCKQCGINVLSTWEPGIDAKQDLKVLLELAERFNLVNAKIEMAPLSQVELSAEKLVKPSVPPAQKSQAEKKSKTKTLQTV